MKKKKLGFLRLWSNAYRWLTSFYKASMVDRIQDPRKARMAPPKLVPTRWLVLIEEVE